MSAEGPGATGPGWGAREGQEERGGQSPTWVLQAGGTRAAVGHSQAPGTHPNLWATPGCSGLPSQCLAGVLAFFARSVTNWRSDSLTGSFPWCLPPPPTCASQSKVLGQPAVILLVLKWLPSPQVPHRDTLGAVHGSAGPGSAGHVLRDPGAPGLRLARIHGVLSPLAWPWAPAWEPG